MKINKASEFLNLKGIEYFLFEEDFIEANVRCIPMVVRFKMDAVGIKLKLSEWCRFTVSERKRLAVMPCCSIDEQKHYHDFLDGLVIKYTGDAAGKMEIDLSPPWANLEKVPAELQAKAGEFNWRISILQWRLLSNLQRFALLKLQKPGHENKNFPVAMREFNLVQNVAQTVGTTFTSGGAFSRIINRHEFMNNSKEQISGA